MDALAAALASVDERLARAREKRAAMPSRREACAPKRIVRKNSVGATWPPEKHEAVQSLAAKDTPYSIIAKAVGAHPDTISDYCRAYDCVPQRYKPQWGRG